MPCCPICRKFISPQPQSMITSPEYGNQYQLSILTYRDLCSGDADNISPRTWEKAHHDAEFSLLFGTAGLKSMSHCLNTSLEIGLSREVQDFWLAFISDPVSKFKRIYLGDLRTKWHSPGTEKRVADAEQYFSCRFGRPVLREHAPIDGRLSLS